MVVSKYTKLKKINASPSLPYIVDFIDVKDFACNDKGDIVQVTITYALCVEPEDWEKYLVEQKAQMQKAAVERENKELDEACNTILRTDPFGATYNGKKLIEIIKADFLWFDKALKEMKNPYILPKLKLIKEAIDNGKIDV